MRAIIPRSVRLRWMGLIPGTAMTLAGATASSHGYVVPTSDDRPEPPALLGLLEDYLRTDDADERASLAGFIEKTAAEDAAAVADALARVQIWADLPDRCGTFSFDSGSGERVTIAYQLPAHYDPTRRHGLIVCMPDKRLSPGETLALAARTLGTPAAEFILLCPNRPLDGSFHQPLPAAGGLRRLIRFVRKRVHTDTDRAFLFGSGRGGDAAWMAAIWHPDLFAGAIILSAYPQVPYPKQVYPLLLENLSDFGVLTVWRAAESQQAYTREERVTAYNRAVAQLARAASLPITAVQISGEASAAIAPSGAQITRLLARCRTSPGRSVSHWFRYPAQGDAGWLRQSKYEGEVWEAEQLSILPTPATDRDRFITEIIRARLAYLGGRIEGQAITIETRRCARIELLLRYGQVDFNRPITVRCNGRKRYDRLVHPSIRTLLVEAYASWEFQHPVAARLSFGIKRGAGGR